MKKIITLCLLLCMTLPLLGQSKWEKTVQIRVYEPVSASFSYWYRFNDNFAIAASAGMGIFIKDEDGTMVGISTGEAVSKDQFFIPLYASMKCNFIKEGSVRPYAKLDVGYNIGTEKNNCYILSDPYREIGGGYNCVISNLSLGIDIKTKSKINQVFMEVGCDLMGFGFEDYASSREAAVFSIGLGFRF